MKCARGGCFSAVFQSSRLHFQISEGFNNVITMGTVLFSALYVPNLHEANLAIVTCCFVRSVAALQLSSGLCQGVTRGLRPRGPGLLPVTVGREACSDLSSSRLRAGSRGVNAALGLPRVLGVTRRNSTFLSLHLTLGRAATLAVPHQEKEA